MQQKTRKAKGSCKTFQIVRVGIPQEDTISETEFAFYQGRSQ